MKHPYRLIIFSFILGIVCTLVFQRIFAYQSGGYVLLQQSTSQRGGLPIKVTTTVTVAANSGLLQKLHGDSVLMMLIDAPTDVISLYIEKAYIGTLTNAEQEKFRRKLYEYIEVE